MRVLPLTTQDGPTTWLLVCDTSREAAVISPTMQSAEACTAVLEEQGLGLRFRLDPRAEDDPASEAEKGGRFDAMLATLGG